MADGTYCDYPPRMDNNMLSQIASFSNRTTSENLGDVQCKNGSGVTGAVGGAGFYLEQFPAGMPTAAGGMDTLNMQGISMSMANMVAGNQSNQEAMNMMSQAAAGMFDSVMNFALKPEKGLPPTPPGSPDDPKDVQHMATGQPVGYHGNQLHPASMVAMQSSINHNLLAKPVPMRRLSEKRIAQARASLTSINVEPPPPIDHSIGPDSTSSAGQTLARAIAAVQQTQKRPRSEKKAIPYEQKDCKYFERRKRNNNAAKKSRDARKAREDEIAIRASFLEKENAILRAQVTTLREEANSLRQMLLQKRSRH